MKEGVKKLIRQGLRAFGLSVFRTKSLPVGIDLLQDINRIKSISTFQTIIDVGANEGQMALLLTSAAPGANE